MQDEAGWGDVAESRTSGNAGTSEFDTPTVSNRASSTSTRDPSRSAAPSIRSQASARASVEALDLLLSLDVSLQLIHATRDAIKPLETFAAYPGTTGTRVRETVFCEMMGALGARHIVWGFGMQVRAFLPVHCD